MDAQQLRELVSYDPSTGIFTARVKSRGVKPGDRLGSFDTRGYVRITVAGKRHKAHRLAFLYMTGDWPKHEVDHIDMNKSNNRWLNLRDADHSTNQHNCPAMRNSKSGVRGVYKIKNTTGKVWAATLSMKGKRRHLGCFATVEEAQKARLDAKRAYSK